MTTLQVLQEALDEKEVFRPHKNKYVEKMCDIIGDDVPLDMARLISNLMLSSFAMHNRAYINLGRDNFIPVNVVGFVLAKSGAKKTSSVTKLEMALHDATHGMRGMNAQEIINEIGDDFKPEMSPPFSNMLATEAGMIKRLNDFYKMKFGTPYLFVDEISTELATNPDIVPNIKIVAQLFDAGEMKSKPLKDSTNQSDEVKHMGMCGLFIGSEAGILEEEDILKKFMLEFVSKLARRTFFIYPEFHRVSYDGMSATEIISTIKDKKKEQAEAADEISKHAKSITLFFKDKLLEMGHMRELRISKEAAEIYELYALWCDEKSQDIQEETVMLEVKHRHWKVLKLAGAYAVWRKDTNITAQDLKEAIWYGQSVDGSLAKFIHKAQRQPFEILAELFENGLKEIKIHDIIKKKWAKNPQQVQDVVQFANSKIGEIGTLEMQGDYIIFKTYAKIDPDPKNQSHMVSYVPVTGTKTERAHLCNEGYTPNKVRFRDLSKVMSNDCAYTAWSFKDGKRKKENVMGNATFLVLDVDHTDLSDTEASDFLADYKHIVCRTSDGNNPFKYRIIMESDIEIDLNDTQYKQLLSKISDDMPFEIDLLARSQIYFGYADRKPLIHDEAEPYIVSDLIKKLDVPKATIKPLSPEKLTMVWNERLHVFKWFYAINNAEKRAKHGHHQTLWLAMQYAHDIGVDYDTATRILDDIIEFRALETRAEYPAELKRHMLTKPKWQNADVTDHDY